MQTTKNKFGIEVKVQCASCAYKAQTRNVTQRWCNNHKKEVCPQDCCEAWKMSQTLAKVGG